MQQTHIRKREYIKQPEKAEEKKVTEIRCFNCRYVIAGTEGFSGKLIIQCGHCGSKNTMELEAK